MFGKTNPTLTERDVLLALKGVKDPDLGRDLVDLGMIKDIRIDGGTVALTVNLTTPACPLKGQIERDVRTALQARLPGEWNLRITMSAEVRGKGMTERATSPASRTSSPSGREREASANRPWPRRSPTDSALMGLRSG